MDQDRQPPPRASNRFCVAHLRADFPEKGLRSSQHVPARTTDVSASSSHEATQPITQAFLLSTLSAPTIFESWGAWIQKPAEKATVVLEPVSTCREHAPERHRFVRNCNRNRFDPATVS